MSDNETPKPAADATAKLGKLNEVLTKEADLLEAINGENPQACVLISAAFLDTLLEHLLLGFFVDCNTAKNIVDFSKGFVKDFTNRARLAYALGLISKRTLQTLMTIAKIRNIFAHSFSKITFESESVAKLVSSLESPLITEKSTRGFDFGARDRYSICFVHVYMALGAACRRVEHRKQFPDASITYASG